MPSRPGPESNELGRPGTGDTFSKEDIMAIKSHAEYKAALAAWASRTRSEPLDSFRGPGVYEGTGWMSDEWRPICTLEKRGEL